MPTDQVVVAAAGYESLVEKLALGKNRHLMLLLRIFQLPEICLVFPMCQSTARQNIRL